MHQARDAARLEWRRSLASRTTASADDGRSCRVRRRARQRWLWPMRSPDVERPEIATLQVAVGAFVITDADGRPVAAVDGATRRVQGGRPCRGGERGRAAFELVEGTSIRLAGGTAVVFVSIGRLQLAQGGALCRCRSGTSCGKRHRRDAVRNGRATSARNSSCVLIPAASIVRVREGEVSVDLTAGRLTTRAGEALLIDRDRRAERRTIATSGPEWAWVTTMRAAVYARGRDRSGVSRVGEPRAGLALGVCG